MRTAIKLLMLAATVLAALALSATTATAQVTVEDEATDDPCAAINATLPAGPITGGCHVEFQAEDVPIFAHVPGVGELPQSNCEVELEARIGPDGEGYITEAHLDTPHDPDLADCVNEPCETSGNMDLWEIHIEEEVLDEEILHVTFCLSPIGQMGTKTLCSLSLPLVQSGHMQSVTATAANRCSQNPIVSIAGTFNSIEGGSEDEIEIHHPVE
jgi:hypothetical protein